ncbi:MAG TPA: HRDC domain-containing protein, partial [Acidobacteriaceae bacterium]
RLARKKEALLDEEAFQKAIEKLFIHGGAHVDFNNLATRGSSAWKQPYTRQSDYRRNQLELVQRYVDGHQCRMAALVLHFGDNRDGQLRCGLCDFCNPSSASARQYREPTRVERQFLANILDALRGNSGKSLGKLQKDLNIPRKELDLYLSALATAGLVTIEDAEWLKDGETILFRKAVLTLEGEAVEDASELSLQLPDTPGSGQQRLPSGARSTTKSSGSRKSAKPAGESVPESLSPEAQQLEQALKAWRTTVAKKLGMPPFVVLHDKTLRAIAHARPSTPNQLEAIPGMGPAKLDKYGDQILSVCSQN